MAAGYQISRASLDNMLGTEVGALYDALNNVNRRNTWLNDSSHNDAFLTGLGYGGPGAGSEITVLRASFTDLAKLWGISHATQTQASTNDFFFNAKLLGGVNWYG